MCYVPCSDESVMSKPMGPCTHKASRAVRKTEVYQCCLGDSILLDSPLCTENDSSLHKFPESPGNSSYQILITI